MLRARHGEHALEIVEDELEVRAYLYVYRGVRCVRDELQSDVETCIEVAFEDYGVPKTCRTNDDSSPKTAEAFESPNDL